MDLLLENLFDFPGSGEKEADKARKGAKVRGMRAATAAGAANAGSPARRPSRRSIGFAWMKLHQTLTGPSASSSAEHSSNARLH
jgi:hypothetical protein